MYWFFHFTMVKYFGTGTQYMQFPYDAEATGWCASKNVFLITVLRMLIQ